MANASDTVPRQLVHNRPVYGYLAIGGRLFPRAKAVSLFKFRQRRSRYLPLCLKYKISKMNTTT